MSGRRWMSVGAALSMLMAVTSCSAAPSGPGLPTGPRASPHAVHIVQVDQQRGGSPARVTTDFVRRAPTGTTEWSVDSVDPSEASVVMQWVDGPSPECGEVNRVEVNETADAVIVGLADTARDPNLNCLAVGASRQYVLHLQHPLAGRALLEPVTGVSDGLAHFSLGTLPDPTCSADATPADAPVGMADATRRLAPTTTVGAVICRTAWPHGRARATRAVLRTPSAARHLATLLNNAEHQQAAGARPNCTHRSAGAWYAIYFTSPDMQVEVFVDQINCGTVTNGSRTGSTTLAVDQALARAFAS